MKILRIFRKDYPLITAYAELPHRGGKPFGWDAYRLFSLPHRGRGTARNERWMRDASDKLMLPNSVTLMIHRVFKLGNVSQERFSDVGLSQFRASRGAGAGLLEICMHFSSSLRARAARLCVRPNNLCAFRFARLACVLKNLSASRFTRRFFCLPLGFIDGCRRQF